MAATISDEEFDYNLFKRTASSVEGNVANDDLTLIFIDPDIDSNAYDSALGEVDATSEYSAEDDIYDIVDSVVPRTDDPKMPALTFRVWAMGFM